MGEKAVVAGDDGGGDGMQCGDHPYRSNPGGICAFCLQEKLGKLVTSSKSSAPFFPVPPPAHQSFSSSSSSSTPPSLGTSAAKNRTAAAKNGGASANKPPRSVRPRIPFFHHGSGHGYMRRRKKRSGVGSTTAATTTPMTATNRVGGGGFGLRRSKSVAPRVTAASGSSEVDSATVGDSPRKRWFWSFLHFSSDPAGGLKHHQQQQQEHQIKASEAHNSSVSTGIREEPSRTLNDKTQGSAAAEEAESPSQSQEASSSVDRKVSRSRSVGCGSRSFSGDFLDRISTGFGDCALRRAESQRDIKPKTGDDEEAECKRQQQRMRCGGIFGGFGMISSSSYWLPVEFSGCAGRLSGGNPLCRGKGWGWAFASPIKAFRPSSKSSITTTASMP